MRIIISRTDSIGDVVLTLPMAGVIKQYYPNSEIVFLGRTYTEPIVNLSKYVDQFENYDHIESLNEEDQIQYFKNINADVIIHVLPNKNIAKIAKKSSIALRVGTTNRIFHWNTCNKLIPLSRKNSSLHEAQLNIKLLSFLNITTNITLNDMPIYYGFENVQELDEEWRNLLEFDKKHIIFHPKSQGNGKEWNESNYITLAESLANDPVQIFITGVEKDRPFLQKLLQQPNVIDLIGKMSLDQFISFINSCDALLASGTGPLHIAAALGSRAVGLFPMIKPIFPQRWAPIGFKSKALVNDEKCPKCLSGNICDCINNIDIQLVKDNLLN